MKRFSTTAKDFKLFKKYYIKYLNFFELNNYNVYFFHKELNGNYAETITDIMAHNVTVRLNKSYPDKKPTEEDIKRHALHEIGHLLIAKLEWLATCRYLSQEEIRETDEEITVKLENSLYKIL